jgi:hypothetical protein
MNNFPEFFRYSVVTSVGILADVCWFCELFHHMQNHVIICSLLHK